MDILQFTIMTTSLTGYILLAPKWRNPSGKACRGYVTCGGSKVLTINLTEQFAFAFAVVKSELINIVDLS